ncbi:hypothetical protein [Mucilaginibacter myungsuensis]|uniref:Uncharacterized protein n=1 Tax=Mucilaginibacter myungsuensis TaxID=649104 RepID=A0A929KYN3_9SPHI|nr:hypothetical protein [Mucilaginibacter myungsuensis]MBE9664106.1 hypothetical protein [Mucilaginibacter myungsuensis]MDN3601285.1 hypothetical protein [Mucilaginibacter myungsuensis]
MVLVASKTRGGVTSLRHCDKTKIGQHNGLTYIFIKNLKKNQLFKNQLFEIQLVKKQHRAKNLNGIKVFSGT